MLSLLIPGPFLFLFANLKTESYRLNTNARDIAYVLGKMNLNLTMATYVLTVVAFCNAVFSSGFIQTLVIMTKI